MLQCRRSGRLRYLAAPKLFLPAAPLCCLHSNHGAGVTLHSVLCNQLTLFILSLRRNTPFFLATGFFFPSLITVEKMEIIEKEKKPFHGSGLSSCAEKLSVLH